MTIKKIWMSRSGGSRNRYALGTLGGILGIVMLMVCLIAGVTAAGLVLDWPMQWVSVLTCGGVTALGVWLGLAVGRRSLGQATVFFLTGDGRLFFLNAADENRGRDPLDYAAGALDTQALLRRLAAAPYVPAGAGEILQVESIRENARTYALRCRMRVGSGPVFRRTCLLVKGLEEEDLLLYQLERRLEWRTDLEPRENRNPLYLVLSGGVLGVLVLLCIFSHPGVAALPAGLYFPCLGGAFAALFVLVYFLVRQQRGE